MGLPTYFSGLADENLRADVRALRASSSAELVSVCGDPQVGLRMRHAAGTLLALLGDPRINTTSPNMITLKGGKASLGTEPEALAELCHKYAKRGVRREWLEKECPRFEVDFAAFRIAKYPVTNSEYLDFLRDTQFAELPTSWEFGRFPLERSNHPVWTVTAHAADEYCRWLSRKTGRMFRLPSEVEWEFAARGNQRREFPWGNTFSVAACNTLESGILNTTPVGIFLDGATPEGVLDLAGNVEEFVADYYVPWPGAHYIEDDLARIQNANGAQYKLQRQKTPYRVARGGSFTRFEDLARCARRHGWYPGALYAMGFRISETI